MRDTGELCIETAERAIGYTFRNTSLLAKALTHASVTDARVDSNERLEFLGDSVLGLVTRNASSHCSPTCSKAR